MEPAGRAKACRCAAARSDAGNLCALLDYFCAEERVALERCDVWLLYPAIYLVYLLLRGALFGLYPYPFIDAGELGYPRMLINASLFFVIFLGLGLLVVALGRWRAGDWRTGAAWT